MTAASPAHQLQRLVQERVVAPPPRDKYPAAVRLLLPIVLSAALWVGIIALIRLL